MAAIALLVAVQSYVRKSNDVNRSSVPSERANGPWFEEVAAQRGLSFVYHSQHAGRYLMPEIMGGGAALFDMDGDGDLDLFFVESDGLTGTVRPRSNGRIFRNRGDGTFEDVTAASGIHVTGYGMGVAAADFDNDGAVDLYVTRVGSNVLLRNDGHGHFTDVTAAAGVADSGWSTSAAFVDIDGDGYLDLFVVHYITWSLGTEQSCFAPSGAPDYCSPKSYHAPSPATLFHNTGHGTFTDVSRESGVQDAAGNGLGITVGDFDDDGRLDIFVANDGTMNHLWLNQGSGRFHNAALEWGAALDYDGKAKAGMGIHAIDADDDGDLDVLVVNLTAESDSFYRNQKTHFEDDSAAVGLRTGSRAFTRFGTAMVDFDNDGRLDLFEACGGVALGTPISSKDPFAQPLLLFRGTDHGRFQEVAPRGGIDRPLAATSRAAVFGDLDNDGGIDIIVVNRDAPAYLLHNVVSRRGHWAGFRVIDEHGRDALGARVTASVAGKRVRRDVQTAYSYLASNDPRVHFGLGPVTALVDVQVRWIDGATESFGTIRADRYVTLRRGAGRLLKAGQQ
jgi:enediyne biosynthesis protein E4